MPFVWVRLDAPSPADSVSIGMISRIDQTIVRLPNIFTRDIRKGTWKLWYCKRDFLSPRNNENTLKIDGSVGCRACSMNPRLESTKAWRYLEKKCMKALQRSTTEASKDLSSSDVTLKYSCDVSLSFHCLLFHITNGFLLSLYIYSVVPINGSTRVEAQVNFSGYSLAPHLSSMLKGK